MNTRLLLVAASTIALGACTTTSVVSGTSPDTPLSGTVVQGLTQPRQIELLLDGKTYRGEWQVSAPTTEQRAGTSYPHRRHVGMADTTLVASDGSIMTCRWQTHAKEADGVCTANGREYQTTVRN